MKEEVLYIRVKEDIKKKIEEGILKEGNRIPSFVDLSKKYRVSIITIRKAIEKLIDEGYLETKGIKGTYVKIKRNNTKIVATIFQTNIKNPFIGEIYSGMSKTLSVDGFHILFFNTEGKEEKELKYLKELLEREIDGIIISPVFSQLDSPSVYLLKEFKRKKVPVVFVDIKIEGLNFDYVETNNFYAGYSATKYLIEKGHRKIGIILGANVNTMKERYAGYLKALKDYNIEFNQLYVKKYAYQNTYEDTGYICGLELLNLKDPPTAIFCTTDAMALGVYKVCYQMRLKIPDDISIMGFDNLSFTEYLIPALTTVNQEKEKMGEEAARLLMSRIKGDTGPKQEITLNFEIIERESVKDLVNRKGVINKRVKVGECKLKKRR